MITPKQQELVDSILANRITSADDITGHAARAFRALLRLGIVDESLNVDEDRLATHARIDWSLIPIPALVVLNYSGGKQSSALLHMVLRGDIEVDKSRFIVLNADPGMENSSTYVYNEIMRRACQESGIYFETVDGPSLLDDILELEETGGGRIDNPPYWTRDMGTGQRGRLSQKCTRHYKINPMTRRIRQILEERHGISRYNRRMPHNLVEKWIGFSYDEVHRIKPSQKKYIKFKYPLIEMKMRDEDVINYYRSNGIRVPQRSVCNACFANGLRTLFDMYKNRPQDWADAVLVDNSVRDWSQIGVQDEVYVSSTLVPLEDMESVFDSLPPDASPEQIDLAIKGTGRVTNLENDYSCDSGYCFV